MRRLRPWLMLVLALASGGVAAWLALRYVRQQTAPLMAAEPRTVQVVLAAHPMQIGSVITDKDVKLVPWPGTSAPVGFVSRPEDAIGRGIITPVGENEPLLTSKMAPKGAGGGLPIVIKEGMRAMSVRVNDVIGVAGFVLPGTRVDVLVTLDKNPDESRPQRMTRTILQNIPVLTAGQSVQRDAEGKPLTVTVITLAVSPDQAELLALADREGQIQLALRNTLDTVTAQTRGALATELNGKVVQVQSKTPPPVPRIVRVVPPRVESTIIEGFKGGQRTLTTFQQR